MVEKYRAAAGEDALLCGLGISIDELGLVGQFLSRAVIVRNGGSERGRRSNKTPAAGSAGERAPLDPEVRRALEYRARVLSVATTAVKAQTSIANVRQRQDVLFAGPHEALAIVVAEIERNNSAAQQENAAAHETSGAAGAAIIPGHKQAELPTVDLQEAGADPELRTACLIYGTPVMLPSMPQITPSAPATAQR